MSEIYIVIVKDRHTDTMVYPFSSAEKSISEARRIAKEYCLGPEDYEEHDYGKDVGWLFFANYSREGDHVRVVKAVMDKKI